MQFHLPPEVWSHVLSFLTTPDALCNASVASRIFHDEISAPYANEIWKRLWDVSARVSCNALPSWAHVPGLWREQVAASYHLERLPTFQENGPFVPQSICIPSRYVLHGLGCKPHPDDALFMPGGRVDIDDVLGRVICVQALGKGVVIGFEHGLGLLLRAGVSPMKVVPRALSGMKITSRPVFHYDDSWHLNEILMFAPRPTANGVIMAITANCNLIRIKIEIEKHRPLESTLLEVLSFESGNPISLALSEDDRYALVGFSGGGVRMIDIEKGSCRVAFSLPGPVEQLVANSRWIVATTSYNPIHVAIWDLTENLYAHSLSQSSSGWAKVTAIAGLIATTSNDLFVMWNGVNAIRFINAKTGEITRVIHVNSRFSEILRNIADEGDYGRSSTQLGRARMVPMADKKRVAVAASNRVFLVSISRGMGWTKPLQLEGARRSTLAFSNDDRVLVTAEGQAYGALGSRIMGRTALGALPKLKFWDTQDGTLRGEIDMLTAVTELSVCGDTVAAVCGALGQVMVFFGRPRQTVKETPS